MTIARQQSPVNKIMEWVRCNTGLDAHKGFRCYDLDGVMFNVESNRWIILETKCENKYPAPHQELCLSVVNQSMSLNKKIDYQGCYLIQLSNDLPSNGSVTIWQMVGDKFQKERIIHLTEDSDEIMTQWFESKLLKNAKLEMLLADSKTSEQPIKESSSSEYDELMGQA